MDNLILVYGLSSEQIEQEVWAAKQNQLGAVWVENPINFLRPPEIAFIKTNIYKNLYWKNTMNMRGFCL